MSLSAEKRVRELKEALALMPWWAKEKARRYQEQKKLAEKLFGPVVRQIQQQQKAK